jgi:uncharacterized protein (TIGR03000 family)
MKVRLFVCSLVSSFGLLASTGSAQAQILGWGGRDLLWGGGYPGGWGGAYGGGWGGWGGYYGGLSPYSNEGRSFTNEGYGFRSSSPSSGWSPYAGTPGEVSYRPSNNSTGDPLLAAIFPPGSGVSGDLSLGTNLPRQTFVTGPSASTDKIEFELKVPTPDTKVYFNGNLVPQTGEDRRLGTPPLKDGITYAYAVRATWITSDGKEVSYVKSLHAKAGQHLTIDFTTRVPKVTETAE